jgi:hypothetical protein
MMVVMVVVDNDLTLLYEYIKRTEHLKLGEITRFGTPHHKNRSVSGGERNKGVKSADNNLKYLQFSIDGVPIPDMEKYRITSTRLFNCY